MRNTKPARKGTKPTPAPAPSAPAKETVGRTYEVTYYGLHSRLIGGDGVWYGATRYKTLEAAKAALSAIGSRFTNIGGITMEFISDRQTRYEYRIVKAVAQCEVLHLEIRAI